MDPNPEPYCLKCGVVQDADTPITEGYCDQCLDILDRIMADTFVLWESEPKEV